MMNNRVDFEQLTRRTLGRSEFLAMLARETEQMLTELQRQLGGMRGTTEFEM